MEAWSSMTSRVLTADYREYRKHGSSQKWSGIAFHLGSGAFYALHMGHCGHQRFHEARVLRIVKPQSN